MNGSSLRLVGMFLLVSAFTLTPFAGIAQENSEKTRRLQWFREAKFGLFIHWGLYAIPAGEWKGKVISGISEWIMYRTPIPVKEYAELAGQFNPVKFDADAWVKMAYDAGMKYVVITSKHHDGFAMYHSKASPYNIVDATPFKRDPMKELAKACRKYGLKFCFYYSQTQDWYEPFGVGNDWDFTPPTAVQFEQYLEKKVIPQVREILTQYGPIGLIWFDTPRDMTPAQSKRLADLVHEIQPDCLVDGRIGNNMGDYQTKGDNRLPSGSIEIDWETPATMNTSWGYKKSDTNWKSSRQLIRALVEVAAKGGNYLLNVGPTGEGTIQQESIDRLREVGTWAKAYEKSVFGTRMSPWVIPPEWGMITVRPGILYLHVFQWPTDGRLVLNGLRNKVRAVQIYGRSEELPFEQSADRTAGRSQLSIDIPARAPNDDASVVVVSVIGDIEVEDRAYQEASGTVHLYGLAAYVKNKTTPGIRKDDTGIRDWKNASNGISWEFVITRPGTFDVTLGSYPITTGSGRTRRTAFEGGHELIMRVGTNETTFRVDSARTERPSPYFMDIVSDIGKVTIATPGIHTLTLNAANIQTRLGHGCVVRWVRLTPIP